MSDLFKKGIEVRSEVLGAEYVERSLKQADPFMAEFQRFVTEFVWGSVWARDGLSRKIRSMLNIAMLTGLNRQNELKLHLQAALKNGVSPDEIKEILLQSAVYAGVPAAFDSFLIARDVIASHQPAAGDNNP
ncbi:MAG: carboxymuconolactone decarboxylase family protein [Pseudomonadota bacterium]